MFHFGEDGEFVWTTQEELDGILAAHRDHLEIPILAIGAYLFFLSWGPKAISTPWNVKYLLVLWNAMLAIFSMIGSYYLSQGVYERVQLYGFKDSVCTTAPQWWLEGPLGLWATLFCYSKFPELIDTVFLIIRKKEVIFLHWYHHVTVLLYCWYSYHLMTNTAIWFGLINFIVHSIMYTYYALAILGVKIVFKFAPIITAIQILQMVGGIFILLFVAFQWFIGEECEHDLANVKLGLTMYVSYFVLFGFLFSDKYLNKPKKSKKN